MFNAYWEPLAFELRSVPPETRSHWRCCIDTSRESPDDINPWHRAPEVETNSYVVQPRSMVLLALSLEAALDHRPHERRPRARQGSA